VITTIHKKEDTSDVRNYRGITLLCMAYKGSLPETHVGFRKGRGIMEDNVRILQHIINKEISQKKKENVQVLHRFKGSL